MAAADEELATQRIKVSGLERHIGDLATFSLCAEGRVFKPIAPVTVARHSYPGIAVPSSHYAACGPYCMSCGMSDNTMARKIRTAEPVLSNPK